MRSSSAVLLSRSLLFLLLITSSSQAQLPVIQLTALSRSGARAGTDLELRVAGGTRLEEVTDLRFSHPGITVELLQDAPLPFSDQKQPRYGTFQVTVAMNVPIGRYEVRAVGRHGISNPRAFMVHDFSGGDAVANPGSNIQNASKLLLNTMYHAKATARQIHYFNVEVGTDPLRIECFTNAVDSRMIPTLRLIGSDNRTQTVVSGSETTDLRFVITKPGSYTIAVHDTLYRGGEEFGYQLLAQPSNSAIELVSKHQSAAQGQLPAVSTTNAYDLTASDWSAELITEQAEATTIKVPSRFMGKLDSSNDRDEFEFQVSKGEPLIFDVASQRFGYPTDCRLFIERAEKQPDGNEIWRRLLTDDDNQEVGDTALRLWTSDPYALFTAPESGKYRLVIHDLDLGDQLQTEQFYVCDIRRPDPDFELVAYRSYPDKDESQGRPFGSQLMRGGVQIIRVFCMRQDGWGGPVELSVEGLPPGVSCRPATLAANQTNTQLTLVAAMDAPRSVSNIKVVGIAQVAEEQRRKVATAGTLLYGKGHSRNYIRSRLTQSLAIFVSDQDVQPVSINMGDGKPIEIKRGQSTKLKVVLTRQDGGKQNCVFRPRDFPAKVSSGEVTINGDKSEGDVEIKTAGDTPLGTYTLWWQVETKVKLKTNPQMIERAKAYRDQLLKLLEDPARATEKDAITAAIATADAKIKSAEPFAKDQEFNVFLPTPHVTIRVVKPESQ